MAEAARAARRRPIRWAAVALVIHNWLGLELFILSVVLLSGTLAVFRYEIDWAIYPALRVEPGPSLAGASMPSSMRSIAPIRKPALPPKSRPARGPGTSPSESWGSFLTAASG